MATTTIPWSDGSGDNIYLTYSSASGDQIVTVSSDANTGSARTQTVTFSASGASSVSLTVNQDAGLPYTPVEYIETDGYAYINTGIKGNDPRSCELKFMVGSVGAASQCVLGTGSNTEDTNLYMLSFINANGKYGFSHRYFYVNSNFQLSASSLFEAKCAMKKSSQVVQLKMDGESSFTSFSKTQSATLTTNRNMYLFVSNQADTQVSHRCSEGSRLYYCKIYSTNNYTNLVFDGVPCYYNGTYGLWDKVTNAFFGSANYGVFSGPSV